MGGHNGGPPGHAPYPGCETGGAPKIDREWYAENLISWVQDEDNWILKDWRIKWQFSRATVINMCNSSDKFLNAYEYAHDVIASRREKMNHNDEMKDSLYGMHKRVYDRDLDAQLKDEKKFEGDLKAINEGKGNSTVTVNLID